MFGYKVLSLAMGVMVSGWLSGCGHDPEAANLNNSQDTPGTATLPPILFEAKADSPCSNDAMIRFSVKGQKLMAMLVQADQTEDGRCHDEESQGRFYTLTLDRVECGSMFYSASLLDHLRVFKVEVADHTSRHCPDSKTDIDIRETLPSGIVKKLKGFFP